MRKVIFFQPRRSDLDAVAVLAARADVRTLGVVVARDDPPVRTLAEKLSLSPLFVFPDLDPADLDCQVVVPDDFSPSDLPVSIVEQGLHVIALSDFRTETPHPHSPGLADDDVSDSLASIERALDPQRLLDWLLELARDRFAGAGGSLMLPDPVSRELYIATAHGLSDATVYQSRVPLGEGIAGRVAVERRGELILEPVDPTERGDRPGLHAALCIPLVHHDRTVGVLNLTREGSEPPFDETDLAAAEALSERLARILLDADGLSRSHGRRLRMRLDRALHESMADGETPDRELAGWAAVLAQNLGAQHASLAFLRADGSLLIGEGANDGEIRVVDADQRAPAWDDVLSRRRTVIARQEADPEDEEAMTILFMPVGREPLRGAVSLCFATSEASHHFQRQAPMILDLLDARLTDFDRRHRQIARIAALKALAKQLGNGLFAGAAGAESPTELGTALRAFTGARHVLNLRPDGGLQRISGDPAEHLPDAADAVELLAGAGVEGWHITTRLADGHEAPLSLLALPAPGSDDSRGCLLLDKMPRHPLDAPHFDDFDAGLARRLLSAWSQRRGRLAASAAAAGPATTDAATKPAPPVPASADRLRHDLAREISRSARYHVAFSLSSIRSRRPLSANSLNVARRMLADGMRESDRIYVRDDILLILAPETSHAVQRLEARAIDLFCAGAGVAPDALSIRRVVYPGRFETAEEMLDQVLGGD